MSDYQVTIFGMCGECKYHKKEKTRNLLWNFDSVDWACDNENSDYYTDYTEYTDTCPMWEQRGVE